MTDLLVISLPGISIPVALGAVAVLGYLIGRWKRAEYSVEKAAAVRDLKKARGVIREMESTANTIRAGLHSHQLALQCFKSQLASIAKRKDSVSVRELAEEVESILRPTLHLSRQMGHAYDELRQQTHVLQSFTEVRTDPLTQIHNRRAFDETVGKLFAMLSRYGNTFSIALFDIDHFKQLNDEHGHIHGDEVLRQVADAFRDAVRETDFVARYGGEEFVILMPATGLSGARVFSDRAREMIARKLSVTVSGGVAMAGERESTEELLARADAALYAAKEAGRNLVFQHDGGMIKPVTAMPTEETDPVCEPASALDAATVAE